MEDGWMGDAITCPYCNYRYEDSWQFFDDGADGDERFITCENCGEGFHVEIETRVFYSTSKPGEAE
jgi:transcription elongation factor Elf1